MADRFIVRLQDKEPGFTSFQSLSPIKAEFKGEKIGHAGTLDKFASGLMVVLIGKATKLNPLFSAFGKEYIATIRFGKETATLDPEGEIVSEAELPKRETLLSVLPSFLGEQKQVPPEYSAIHVDGKRAYKAARSGQSIEMPVRDITIESLDLLSFDGERAVIRTSVSKGTYIRSLARDIARKAGSCGYVENLRRLRIGPWSLDDLTLSTDRLLEKTGMFSTISLDPRRKSAIDNGNTKHAVKSDSDPSLRYAYLTMDGKLYGIGEKSEGRLSVIARI